ncbi:MAG: hypothetical protein M0Q53_20740 [Prolixibacteraceae bacterium]|jgi:hypothetical protein|nr:hypothetical protein [Prolixibacteraceae bacterium]
MATVINSGKYTYTAFDDIDMIKVLRDSLASPRCSDEEAIAIQSARVLLLEKIVERLSKRK